MISECNLEPWVGSWNRKRKLGKKYGNLNEVCTARNNNT